ncbi:MAG: hypothetical protein EA401_04330 [Planctomycetota bacterium]|nr:MAG: hypothetical protein EA401_04330 [Planctomycetota bacterium]
MTTAVSSAWQATATPQPLTWKDLAEAADGAHLNAFQLQQIQQHLGEQKVCWLGTTGHRRDVGLWWRWARVWFVAGETDCLWIALRRRNRPAPQPWQVMVPRVELAVAYNPATGAVHALHPDQEDLPPIMMPDHLAHQLCVTLRQSAVTVT